ncbi:uncharacterized protein LOC144926119 isoform X1 [Branchiostoma floridae x Branchiostoma belcheri]
MEEDMDVGDGEAEGGNPRVDGGDRESDGESDGVDRGADGGDGEDRGSDGGDGESDGGDRESDGGDGDREDSESGGNGESNGGDRRADRGDRDKGNRESGGESERGDSDGGDRGADRRDRETDGESDGGADESEGWDRDGGDRGYGADIGDRVAGRDGGNQRWQLFVKGLGGKTTIIRLNRNATVDRLINVISASNGIPPESQRVLYTTKQLEYGRGKRLSDYNIQDKSTLFVVLRLRGGSSNDSTSSSLKTLPEDVERTEEPDMISGEDDPNTPRARMSCGHAITPETLYIYCQSLLSAGKYIFHCPYISERTGDHCGEEWSYIDVRRLADLSQDDQKRFETMISQNYLRRGRGIQECPRCKSYCERMSNVCRRVVCPLCTVRDGQEYHFCWYCLHSWDTPGNSYCGNADCRGEDRRLEILRTCGRKTIVGVPGCPAIRACLTCGMLIEHDRACKHMTCICEEKFCFICLTPAILGNYQCGTFNSPCEVADVQTAIPGDD